MHFQSTACVLAQDDGLVQRIAAGLHRRLGIRVRDFRISAHEDGLILHGRVNTFYGKQVAQQVAMELSGVPIVANEIEVL